MLTPEQIAAKWQRNAAAAGGSYKDGVNAVTTSPTARAVANADQYLAGVQRGFEKWKANTGRVTLESWKRSAVEKGAQRYTSGVTQGADKFAAFVREFAPHLQSVQNELAGMPRGDLETNIGRMVHVVRRNAEFRRR